MMLYFWDPNYKITYDFELRRMLETDENNSVTLVFNTTRVSTILFAFLVCYALHDGTLVKNY